MITNSSWKNLSLNSKILSVIENKLQFISMTPIQETAIPLFLQRKDIAAEAVTGSGKTLAFLIPILEILLKLSSPLTKYQIGALILSPTRELAIQISEVLAVFLEEVHELSQLRLIGGSSLLEDLNQFGTEGGNILVATPGRLEDILTGKTTSKSNENAEKLVRGFKSVEILILDEADRLLTYGFEKAITTILSFLPKQRRTSLFSATQTKDVDKLIRAGLRNPVLISVTEKQASSECRTPLALDNAFMEVCPEKKLGTLIHFIKELSSQEKVIVFFSTCACVEYFSILLQRLLRPKQIFSLHGQKGKRGKVFKDFRVSEGGIMICTDVMARGVDIPEVNWVIQFDPPSSAEAFVHRIGRTARIGKSGSAILYLLPTEDAYVDFIQLNQKISLKKLEAPTNITSYFNEIRSWAKNDRDLFDKGIRAFVSYIMAYSKHECKFILRVKDLPMGHLATYFGLLKLPKMPELKGKTITGFTEEVMDFNDIKYKDKQKEKSRLDKLKVYKESGIWPGSKIRVSSTPWSKKVLCKEKKFIRSEKKNKRKKSESSSVIENQEDLEELEADFKLYQKLKRGKITVEEYDEKNELENVSKDEPIDNN